ncbi:hypothetical protein AgCh_005431 [Apium graveolens]
MLVQKAALIEINGAQSRKERDNKKRKVFHQNERSESGYQQDRNVKRIGFQKGWNAQKLCEKKHLGICNKLNMTCYQCNQKGHLANECKVRKPGLTCYKCGKVGHIAKECRSTRLIKNMINIENISIVVPPEMLVLPPPPTMTPQASERTFNLKMKDVVQNSEVIADKLSINNVEAKVLIDSGATRSFISKTFANKLNCDKKNMSEAMDIVISNQEKIHVSQFFPQYEIDISGHKFLVFLILFKSGEFDIILGIDWLGKNNAQIDCRSKKVYFLAKNGNKVIFKGQKEEQLFLTTIQARKLLRKGCEAYLA